MTDKDTSDNPRALAYTYIDINNRRLHMWDVVGRPPKFAIDSPRGIRRIYKEEFEKALRGEEVPYRD